MVKTDRSRRDFVLAAGAAATLVAFAPLSALAAPAVRGRDYQPIDPPQPTESGGKIEVIEFFSYGCPHCNDFHKPLDAWVAKLPADVAFKRVPAAWNGAWANLAKLYYALEVTGDVARLDGAIFAAIHEQGVRMPIPDVMQEWVEKQGVDGRKFADAYKSFGVASKINRANQMVQSYRIGGVPALAVEGRYLVSTEGVKSLGEVLTRADAVIAQARSDKARK
jgi:thiol:disulfide interchange protein DsbA